MTPQGRPLATGFAHAFCVSVRTLLRTLFQISLGVGSSQCLRIGTIRGVGPVFIIIRLPSHNERARLTLSLIKLGLFDRHS